MTIAAEDIFWASICCAGCGATVVLGVGTLVIPGEGANPGVGVLLGIGDAEADIGGVGDDVFISAFAAAAMTFFNGCGAFGNGTY